MTTDAPTYKITKVADFLKVPPDRRDACLKAFAEFLPMAQDMLDVANTFADLLGADKSLNAIEGFTWIDDGKDEVTIRLRPSDEDADKENKDYPEQLSR
jgi:hypothetical protein